MTTSGDVKSLPTWFKLALVVAGAILMLAGAGVIPVDASRFHTPHWVVSIAGLAFCIAGIITFLAPYRDTHPARYLFSVGILVTCLFLVSVAVSIYASGTVIAIGPLLIAGPVADAAGRVMSGFAALILGALACMVWFNWFRATKSGAGKKPN